MTSSAREAGVQETFSETALLDFRKRKDEYFAAGRGPVEREALHDFHGLTYYPPAPEWTFAVPVTLGTGDEVALETTTGETRSMVHFGTAALDVPGGREVLHLYALPGDESPERAFVPFRDATSGDETYGAGRYLDAPLTRMAQGFVVQLDFNRAYHPSCVYSERWTCPLPPRENTLSVAVRAGERLPGS